MGRPPVAAHGHLNAFGYGLVRSRNPNPQGKRFRMALAHRAVYEALVGPTDMDLDHLCHSMAVRAGTCEGGLSCPHRACVNPAHLEPVTDAENMSRGVQAARTHCRHGHAYTPENTRVEKNGARTCRACKREGDAARARMRRLTR